MTRRLGSDLRTSSAAAWHWSTRAQGQSRSLAPPPSERRTRAKSAPRSSKIATLPACCAAGRFSSCVFYCVSPKTSSHPLLARMGQDCCNREEAPAWGRNFTSPSIPTSCGHSRRSRSLTSGPLSMAESSSSPADSADAPLRRSRVCSRRPLRGLAEREPHENRGEELAAQRGGREGEGALRV